jgi:protein-disulfide isomerase
MRHIVSLVLIMLIVICVGCGGGGSQSTQPTQTTQPATVAAGLHVMGNADAKVTVIEFTDFQCPFCKSFYTDTEPQIISTYVVTGKVKFAVRQFPLSIHQNAQIAAEASECAAKVGGNDAFWKYHDVLFTKGQGDGTGLDAASLKQYAADLQLNTTSFNSCLDNHETAAVVSKDVADGRAAGVAGTPFFFINGKQLFGAQPFSTFKAMIDLELQSP